jgi:hypothetical protein
MMQNCAIFWFLELEKRNAQRWEARGRREDGSDDDDDGSDVDYKRGRPKKAWE